MADKIRLRIWVLGIAPVLLVGVGFAVALLAPRSSPHRPPPPAVTPEGASALEPAPAPSPVAVSSGTAPARSAVPPPPPAPTVTLSVGPYGSVSGPPPEPIPELEPTALRPPGSQAWTADQKADYKQHLFEAMDDRERLLRKEIAAAHRSGDAAAEQRKQVTLSYLLRRRAELERMLASSPPPPADPGDASP